MFTNPLDRIRIASPCKSDWNEMYGDGRRRFCGECKMNVYNLSGMSRSEAENLLMDSDGRLCVRFYRRKDGTVLTKDCPVGWQALKRRASRFAVAFSSLIAGVLAGTISFRASESALSLVPTGDVPEPELRKVVNDYDWRTDDAMYWQYGEVDMPPLELYSGQAMVGQLDMVEMPRDRKVKTWIK